MENREGCFAVLFCFGSLFYQNYGLLEYSSFAPREYLLVSRDIFCGAYVQKHDTGKFLKG